MRVFIDSSAIVALNDSDDPLHKDAKKVLENRLSNTFESFLSTNIILESVTLISQRVGKKEGVLLLDELRSGIYTIINPDATLIQEAESLFRSIPSKNVSYSDCVSFVVMRRYGINWVFSFDPHFRKQGFKRVGIDR